MKNVKKSLDEKMQVKLPEALEKDALLSKLPEREPEKKIKQFNVKKLVPTAASLLLVVGLLGVYFSSSFDKMNIDRAPEASGQVVADYSSYDSIYAKFKEMKKEYDNANYATDDEVYYGSKWNDAATDDMPEASNEKVTDFGTTNTQETGVDEGDVVKTDGEYIYVLDRGDGKAAIFDKDLRLIGKIKTDKSFYAYEMYVYKNRLVLAGGKASSLLETTTGKDDPFAVYDDAYMPFGFYNYENATVYVYDISDRANPEKLNEFTQQGNLQFTRMIGSKLYVIGNYYVDLGDKNYKDNCIPDVIINGASKKVDAGCISVIEGTKTPSYTVVSTIDLEKNTEPVTKAVLGGNEKLYASTTALYVTETSFGEKCYTSIHRFDYTDTGVEYKATGKVAGTLHNQFSLSNQGEFLRVATTDTELVTVKSKESADGTDLVEVLREDTTNNLYILDKDMNTVGKVENLAEGEKIESARFVGNMAYIVTFRQTDPLFVIDTTDPKNPKVLSELKIPGFSQYLHPYGEGYLIGVGRDGTDTGANNYLKVSLFDVRDPYNPKEVSKCTVENDSGAAYSNVGGNHKLFVNLPNGEFAVPVTEENYIWNDMVYSYPMSGYIRYRVTDGKIEEAARYTLNRYCQPEGATYLGDTFYVVTYDNHTSSTDVTAYNLTTNEKTAEAKI